jgi:hypothetical protein
VLYETELAGTNKQHGLPKLLLSRSSFLFLLLSSLVRIMPLNQPQHYVWCIGKALDGQPLDSSEK